MLPPETAHHAHRRATIGDSTDPTCDWSPTPYGICLIPRSLEGDATWSAMSTYRLRFLDPSRKFIRADRIDCASDQDAVERAYERHLPVRSELWKDDRLIAPFPPSRHQAGRRAIRWSAVSAGSYPV